MSKGLAGRAGKALPPKEWYLKGSDTRVHRVRIGIGGGKFVWGVPDGPTGSYRRVFKCDMEKR